MVQKPNAAAKDCEVKILFVKALLCLHSILLQDW